MGANYIQKFPLTHEAIKCNFIFECSLAHPSVMIRKKMLLTHGLKYNYKDAEDSELWIRCLKITKLANIPEVLVKYRWHPSQLSTINGASRNKNSSDVSIAYLSSLYKIKSENETAIYDVLLFKQAITSINTLVNAHRWLCTLSSENARKHVFPEPEFRDVLAKRRLLLCKAASSYGYQVFSLYWKSPFRRSTTRLFIEKIKLLLKSFLKIDRKDSR